MAAEREVKWSKGGWLGGVLGSTVWMAAVAVEILVRNGKSLFALLTLLTAGTLLALGWLLWRERSSLRWTSAALVFFAAAYPPSLAVFAFRQLAGLEHYHLERIWLFITVIFALLIARFLLLARQQAAGGQAEAKRL